MVFKDRDSHSVKGVLQSAMATLPKKVLANIHLCMYFGSNSEVGPKGGTLSGTSAT